jgi:hypothetical protein
MKKSIAMLVMALSVMLYVNTSYAAIVTFQFSGTVTGVFDTTGFMASNGIQENTSTFTGSFSYDSDMVSASPYSFAKDYLGANFSITIDGSFDFFVNSPENTELYVSDSNDVGGYIEDGLQITAYKPNVTFPVFSGEQPSFTTEVIELILNDSTGNAMTNALLPTTIDLSNFDLATIYITASTPPGEEFCTYSIDGTITSLTTTVVPIPGALWLLGSGLITFIGLRRKLNS